MCSHIADFLIIDSPSSIEGLSPPSSPHPAGNDNTSMTRFATGRNPSSRKPTRNNVHFQDDSRTEVVVIENLACLSETEKEKLWFTDIEIESFKARARAVCEDIKLGVSTTTTTTTNVRQHQQQEHMGGEDNTRGLELRLCHERQRRKFMILQAILRAQKRYKDPKQLSNIARKCSVWSKAVAALVAQRDYCTLYEPFRMDSLAGFPPISNYPLPFKAKVPPTTTTCANSVVDNRVVGLPLKRPTSPVPHGARRVRPRPTVAAAVAEAPAAPVAAPPPTYATTPFAAPC